MFHFRLILFNHPKFLLFFKVKFSKLKLTLNKALGSTSNSSSLSSVPHLYAYSELRLFHDSRYKVDQTMLMSANTTNMMSSTYWNKSYKISRPITATILWFCKKFFKENVRKSTDFKQKENHFFKAVYRKFLFYSYYNPWTPWRSWTSAHLTFWQQNII